MRSLPLPFVQTHTVQTLIWFRERAMNIALMCVAVLSPKGKKYSYCFENFCKHFIPMQICTIPKGWEDSRNCLFRNENYNSWPIKPHWSFKALYRHNGKHVTVYYSHLCYHRHSSFVRNIALLCTAAFTTLCIILRMNIYLCSFILACTLPWNCVLCYRNSAIAPIWEK